MAAGGSLLLQPDPDPHVEHGAPLSRVAAAGDPAAAARAVDVLQPDLAIAGGLTETLRICALAAAHGLTVAPHLWGSAILFASGLHLAVATPCVTLLELTRGDNPLLNDLVQEPFDLRDGFVHASDRPGLGVTLNREFARSITV